MFTDYEKLQTGLDRRDEYYAFYNTYEELLKERRRDNIFFFSEVVN
jgi:hypothetical protein